MYYLGIDLGGTNIAVGLVDENFNIVCKESTPTNAATSTDVEIVTSMALLCKKILDENNIDKSEVKSIGVGSPGTPDAVNGVVIYSNNLPFRNTKIRKIIQSVIDVPVFVQNDANCAALGEAVAGAAKDISHSVMITLGTGVGGGIIIDKKIYSGFNFAGAELGHHVIVANGELCSCGRRGCWEAYASANALKKQAAAAALANKDSYLYKLIDGKAENVTGKSAFDAMRNGDATGKAVVMQYVEYVGIGIANMINVFQPEIFIIGGGVSKEGNYLLDLLNDYVNSEDYCRDIAKTTIKIATLGNDAGIIGAAALGKNN